MKLSMKKRKKNCPICNYNQYNKKFEYFKPPLGEIKFKINSRKYHRTYFCCKKCGHWFQKNNLLPKSFYSLNYNKMTYSNELLKTFKKIINLPKKKSDNYHRLKRINEVKRMIFNNKKTKLLDIGSGLGIFPYSAKKIGWNCTALDPDLNSVNHIKKNLKIKCFHGEFKKGKSFGKFDILTFNKVLEHTINPTSMLKEARNHLNENGIVYVELPDAEIASQYGKQREEFFIDHIHVFSFKSLKILSIQCGYKIIKINRIKEPSGKFTLFAFLQT